MKTDVTYINKGVTKTETVNCLNPSNAPAMLFNNHPELDPLSVTIVNCIGRVTFTSPDTHFHSHANNYNKS